MRGRPRGAQDGDILTIQQIAQMTGIPRSTVYRLFDRSRDILTLEIIFATLPRRVQKRWLRNKLATV